MNLRKTPWANNKDREAEMTASKVFLDALVKKAQECLNDAKFLEYQAMFRQYEVQTVNDIIALNDNDPLQYAFKVRQLVDTLKAYRLLISAVEEDASRKVEK